MKLGGTTNDNQAGKFPEVVSTTKFLMLANQYAAEVFGIPRGIITRTSLMNSLLPVILERGDAVALPQNEPCRMIVVLTDAILPWVYYMVRRRELIQAQIWSRIHKYSMADFDKLSTMTTDEFMRMRGGLELEFPEFDS